MSTTIALAPTHMVPYYVPTMLDRSEICQPYEFLDRDFATWSGGDIGFESELLATPVAMDDQTFAGFQARHAVILEFQTRLIALFRASLRGDADPRVAQLILGDAPASVGVAYHRALDACHLKPPLFFRTDEPAPGQLSEIQCPGSGWCLHEQVRGVTAATGSPRFAQSLPERFVNDLRVHLPREPVLHHLTENASRPHGMRYFIQKTRQHGLRYFSYDRDVGPGDCTLLRSHDYAANVSHNFHQDRLQRCSQGEFWYDLPPSVLFDGKLPLALPFWEPTRAYFSDAIRAILPYTAIVDGNGLRLEDGTQVTAEDFCNLPGSARDYYLKYAGCDVAVNWGSRSVYLANSGPRAQCQALMERIATESAQGRPWIAQRARRTADQVTVLDRSGATSMRKSYLKWSGFYGPQGLMGIMVMAKNFQKVHGSRDTAIGIVP